MRPRFQLAEYRFGTRGKRLYGVRDTWTRNLVTLRVGSRTVRTTLDPDAAAANARLRNSGRYAGR